METLIQGALQLGVIPIIALFLILKLHAQNHRLTEMIEKQDESMRDLIKHVVIGMLPGHAVQPKSEQSPQGGPAEEVE